jgi:iron complex transport system substrate-binding protein
MLPQPAERVISLAPSNTEILFAIGAGDVLVGRDEFSDFPAQALEVSSIGSVYGEINLEAVVALEPDLVLAAEINSPEHVDAIQALGIQVYYMANPDDFEGLFENITTLGKLTGRDTQAQNLADQLAARVQKVSGSLQGRTRVRVYYEIDGADDPTAPWTTGSGTFQHHLITMAGGENIAADLQGWKKINVEEIISRDPEVIIYEEAPWIPTTAESIASREGWGGIEAVAEGSIYAIDTRWTGRPGPRYVDAFEAMAEMLHPEAFE